MFVKITLMKIRSFSLMDLVHFIALSSAFLGVAFVINNFVTYIFDFPGLFGTLALFGINFTSENSSYSFFAYIIGFFQSISYILAVLLPIYIINSKTLSCDKT